MCVLRRLTSNRNISSTSKIQRPRDISLQPDTIQVLRKAREAVDNGDFLPRYTDLSQKISSDSQKAFPSCAVSTRSIQQVGTSDDVIIESQASSRKPTSTFGISQSFVALPSQAHQLHATASRCPNAKSLRSSASAESFKSAISIQNEDLELTNQIKAIQSVLHAFQTSLEALENLINRRIRERESEIHAAAISLQDCLLYGSRTFSQKHVKYLEQYGQAYIRVLEKDGRVQKDTHNHC